MSKIEQIKKIRSIIDEWGSVNTCELGLDSSPCIKSIGNGKNNVSQLVERFYRDGVEAITYHDEIELGIEFILYQDLDENIVDEIYNIMLEYDADMNKTMERCQD